MKAFMLTVAVSDNEYPEGGVLLQCPEGRPEKRVAPFLPMTPREDGICIESVRQIAEVIRRDNRFKIKEISDWDWDFVYEQFLQYPPKLIHPTIFMTQANFDLELLFHILGGFPKQEARPV